MRHALPSLSYTTVCYIDGLWGCDERIQVQIKSPQFMDDNPIFLQLNLTNVS